jgi:hypothetical protein
MNNPLTTAAKRHATENEIFEPRRSEVSAVKGPITPAILAKKFKLA